MNRLAAVMALAWAGAVTGHVLGYALSHPVAAERAAWLQSTGHGSFDIVLVVAGTAGAAAVAVAALRTSGPLTRVGGLAVRLLPLQLVMFSFVELAERSFDPEAAMADPAVLLGLVLQVATAGGLALLTRGAQQTARVLNGTRPVPRLRAPGFFTSPTPRTDVPARPAFLDAVRRRAPPLPLVG
ncbi:MAG: hypothetical protein ACRDIX_02700 [Actinomycetota bacterium]